MREYPSKAVALTAVLLLAAGCGDEIVGPRGDPPPKPPTVPGAQLAGVTATIVGDIGTVDFSVPNPDWYDESPGDVTEYLALGSAGRVRVLADYFPERETDWEVAGHAIYFEFPTTATLPSTLEIVPNDGTVNAGEADFDYSQFINVDNVLTAVTGTLVVSEATDTYVRGSFTASGMMSDGTPVTIEDGGFECELVPTVP